MTVVDASLTLFVIYDNPLDYPGRFVVRPQYIVKGRPDAVPAAEPLCVVGTLAEARKRIPPGLVNVGRMPGDEPHIVEVWI